MSGALFRPRGVMANDVKYATPARIISVEEMLAYRECWKEPLTPDFNVEEILRQAHESEQKKPAAPLSMSEVGYHVTDTSQLSELDRVVRNVQGVLNKLTDSNFDELVPALLTPELLDPEVVKQVVDRMFQKALDEPMFCTLYSKLALGFAVYEKQLNDGKLYRGAIVTKSQSVFEASFGHTTGTTEEDTEKLKKRKMANVDFMGELFKSQLLSERVIWMVIGHIMMLPSPPCEMDAEVAVRLLNSIGGQLEEKETRADNVKVLYSRFENLVSQQPSLYAKRVNFAIMNLLELRARGWVKKELESGNEAHTENVKKGPAVIVAEKRKPQQAQQQEATTTAAPPPTKKVNNDAVVAAAAAAAAAAKLPKIMGLAAPPKIDEAQVLTVRTLLKEAAQVPLERRNVALEEALKELEGLRLPPAALLHQAAVHACSIADTMMTVKLFQLLAAPAWDPFDVVCGLAWTLSTAISEGITTDVPRFFTRFCAGIVSIAEETNWQIVGYTFSQAAADLEALSAAVEAAPEWDEEFVSAWEEFLTSSLASDEKREVAALAATKRSHEILDGLTSASPSNFFARVAPDMLSSLLNLCNPCDAQSWVAHNADRKEAQFLASEMRMLLV